MVTLVSIRETSPGVWRVTHNGKVLGDSRGYDKDGARAAALREVDEEGEVARREGRHGNKVYRPA